MPFGVLFSKRVCENNRKLQNLVTGYEYNERRIEKIRRQELERKAARKAAIAARTGPRRYGRRQRREFLDLTKGLAATVLQRTAEEIIIEEEENCYHEDGYDDEQQQQQQQPQPQPQHLASPAPQDRPPFFIDKSTLGSGEEPISGEELSSTHRQVSKERAEEALLRLRVELLWEELHIPYRDRDVFTQRSPTHDQWKGHLRVLLDHRRRTIETLRAIRRREEVLERLRSWCASRRGNNRSRSRRALAAPRNQPDGANGASSLVRSSYVHEAAASLGFEIGKGDGGGGSGGGSGGGGGGAQNDDGGGDDGEDEPEMWPTASSNMEAGAAPEATASPGESNDPRVRSLDEKISNYEALEQAAVRTKDYRRAAKLNAQVQSLKKDREKLLAGLAPSAREKKKGQPDHGDRGFTIGLELAAQLVVCTMDCVRSILVWRRNLWRPLPFLWRGYNYMESIIASENGKEAGAVVGVAASSSVQALLATEPAAATVINEEVLGRRWMGVLVPLTILQEGEEEIDDDDGAIDDAAPEKEQPGTSGSGGHQEVDSAAQLAAYSTDVVASVLSLAVAREDFAEYGDGASSVVGGERNDTEQSPDAWNTCTFYENLVDAALKWGEGCSREQSQIAERSVGQLLIFETFVQAELQQEHLQLVAGSSSGGIHRMSEDNRIAQFEWNFIPMLREGF